MSDHDEKIDSPKVKVVEATTELTSEFRDRVLERFGEKAVNDHLNAGRADIDYVLEKINLISPEEALNMLKEAIEFHDGDVNFPEETMSKIKLLVQGEETYGEDFEFDLKTEACLIGYFSPYPEVRSVTEPFDDPTAYVETFRVYFLAIIWTMIGTGVSQFFAFRMPSIYINSAVIQLFLYPCGRFMQYVLPDWGFTFRGTRHSLNPGPWTYKEQMLATLMVNVANGATYVTRNNIMTQKLPIYYNTPIALGYEFLMNFSSQLFGFGFAGMLRRWVIYPVKAIWPTVLPTLALNRALLKTEKKENINGWTISRYKFFLSIFVFSFVYFWIPDYLFQALSTFNWMTWISPKNFTLAIVTGSSLGLGFNPWTTFDWNVANFNNALSVPFYSAVNQFTGMFIGGFIILALYYTNYKWCAYVPINTNDLRDHFNKSYNVTKILTNGLFDEKKYQAYSPPYYSAGFMVTYGTYFVVYPLALVYITANEWKSISSAFRDFYRGLRYRKRSNYSSFNDPHSKMMAAYKEVPDWYYLGILVLSFVFGVICVQVYPQDTQTPVWGIIVVIAVCVAFLLPITIVQSATGFSLSISVMAEIIAGFLYPGNGMANLILKCYGAQTEHQAESYISDQKMAHYAKIPPMAIFRGQLVSTVFQAIVSVGVVQWQMYNIQNLCAPNQPDKFTCPGLKTIYSASIMWGVIGPRRTFSGVYQVFAWCWLVGFILAPTFWIIKKYYPRAFRYVNPVLIIGGMGFWAPYNLSYYIPNLYLSFAFMFVIRRRFLAWWEKYNYVFSAAMSAGVAFSAIIIFFAVEYYPKTIKWWGNTVSFAGIDGGVGQQTRLPLPEQGYFGLEPGTYP
ncbi:OPT oligopeptide transporter protein-domain-containing protein [Lipomyces kononenkoae]|uniref:OPT oligopeptide transporter protein-domain-containing protein n=1 Tax=Lipomyces kononenkoae TaxID=34357 RepID=A0ACC3T2L8_LIPKO